MSRKHWEQQAASWTAWARRPNFDAYWRFSAAFFELVPPPRGLTLEVGCGEGRVARDLARLGHRVIGVDGSPALARFAYEADHANAYLTSDSRALPFSDASFDLVVFYNSLMDVDDMETSVQEAARVLRPGGKLCACVTHPMMDAGTWESRDPSARFVVGGSYLGQRRWIEVAIEREGLEMLFAGWAYPLESYVRAMENAHFVIEALREPAVGQDQVDKDPSELRWQRVPMFLMWRAAKAG